MKRVDTSFSVIVTCYEESGHFFYKEVSILFMAGYNDTKRSIRSLHGWLQLR
jgi:hypothetical protein